MTLPYEGVRLVDFTQLEQGAVGTQIMADFGADVIKIEPIAVGERGRSLIPRVNGMSCYFLANNRNKRSLTLDLKSPKGKEIVYRLVEGSDIVASNFVPGLMERLDFGFEKLRSINPRIIYAVGSGFGQTGPYRDRPGQDLIAQAMGGLMALTGDADGPPVACGTWIADFIGAQLLAQGMMAALAARERTGRGQLVDCSLLNGIVASHLQESAALLNAGKEYPRPPRGGGHSGSGPLYAVYRCEDGKYAVLMGRFAARPLALIGEALEEPRLAEHADWGDGAQLPDREQRQLRALLEQAFLKFTRAEAVRRLEESGVLAASVYEHEEVFEDPQVVHNEMVIETGHPEYGRVKLTGFPVKLSETPASLRMPPPAVGEHNEEILRWLGYSSDEILDLQQDGVVGAERRA